MVLSLTLLDCSSLHYVSGTQNPCNLLPKTQQKTEKKTKQTNLFKHSATAFNINTTTCQDILHIGWNSNNQEYIQETSIQNQVKNPTPCPVSAQRSVSLRKLLIDCFANSGMLHLCLAIEASPCLRKSTWSQCGHRSFSRLDLFLKPVKTQECKILRDI